VASAFLWVVTMTIIFATHLKVGLNFDQNLRFTWVMGEFFSYLMHIHLDLLIAFASLGSV
jgi:hypothetical protein